MNISTTADCVCCCGASYCCCCCWWFWWWFIKFSYFTTFHSANISFFALTLRLKHMLIYVCMYFCLSLTSMAYYHVIMQFLDIRFPCMKMSFIKLLCTFASINLPIIQVTLGQYYVCLSLNTWTIFIHRKIQHSKLMTCFNHIDFCFCISFRWKGLPLCRYIR